MTHEHVYSNGTPMKTSVTMRGKNKKVLALLLGVIALLLTGSVIYIIIYPNL